MHRAKQHNGTLAFTLGLILLGYGAGHQLVYGLLGISGDLTARSVHGYMPTAGWLVSILTVVAFGLVARALFARMDAGSAEPPWWQRAVLAMLVPALGFVGGELIELAAASSAYVSASTLFAVGVPVQAVIGLVAFLIARLALRGLRAVADIVRSWRGELVRPLAAILAPAPAPRRAPSSPLVSCSAGRAPPLAFV